MFCPFDPRERLAAESSVRDAVSRLSSGLRPGVKTCASTLEHRPLPLTALCQVVLHGGARDTFAQQLLDPLMHLDKPKIGPRLAIGWNVAERERPRRRRTRLSAMAVCTSCGNDVSGEFRFCPFCGAELAPALREQRKTVTVLFCDVAGSTALGESTDPEALRALLAARAPCYTRRHVPCCRHSPVDECSGVWRPPLSRMPDAQLINW